MVEECGVVCRGKAKCEVAERRSIEASELGASGRSGRASERASELGGKKPGRF